MAIGFVALNSYSIADTFFVGQLGTLPLAAMGFTFPISFTMVAIGLGVGIATSSVLARLLGTGNRGAVQRITTHALMLGGLLGLLLLVIGGIFAANAAAHLLVGVASFVWLRKALAEIPAEDRSARGLPAQIVGAAGSS